MRAINALNLSHPSEADDFACEVWERSERVDRWTWYHLRPWLRVFDDPEFRLLYQLFEFCK